ncbi:MAG: response regulator [Nitrospinota bacterium]|nr:response regulator [Nitrospinota bacterium]
MKLHPCFILAKETVEVIIATARSGGHFHDITMINDTPEFLRIYADWELYTEAVTSLLLHAARRAPKGSSVRISNQGSAPATLTIEYGFADDTEELNSLFGSGNDATPPCNHADPSPLRAASIVACHGGRISAATAPGGGTALTVALPDVRPRILVVEDDPDYMTLTKEYLLAVEGVVLEAKNGLEALKVIIDHLPHLVVLDLSMPGMDGYSLLTSMRLSRKAAEMPIIIFSSDSSIQAREKALGMGADKFLMKPDGLKDLAGLTVSMLYRKPSTGK